jgi:hypothetical protein
VEHSVWQDFLHSVGKVSAIGYGYKLDPPTGEFTQDVGSGPGAVQCDHAFAPICEDLG